MAKPFMDEDFLLETPTARTLYHEYAAPQPILDYHCHLPPAEIAQNKSKPARESGRLARKTFEVHGGDGCRRRGRKGARKGSEVSLDGKTSGCGRPSRADASVHEPETAGQCR